MERKEEEAEMIRCWKEELGSEISLILEENKKLREENKKLCEEKAAVLEEKGRLQKEQEMQTHESEGFFSDIEEFQSSKEEGSIKIRQLLEEIASLVEEKEEREKRFDMMMEESSSLVLKLLETHGELEEEMERKKRMVEKVLIAMRRTAEMIRWKVGDDGDDSGYVFVEIEEIEDEDMAMVVPFLAELRAIERCFRKREKEMDKMKGDLQFLI